MRQLVKYVREREDVGAAGELAARIRAVVVAREAVRDQPRARVDHVVLDLERRQLGEAERVRASVYACTAMSQPCVLQRVQIRERRAAGLVDLVDDHVGGRREAVLRERSGGRGIDHRREVVVERERHDAARDTAAAPRRRARCR